MVKPFSNYKYDALKNGGTNCGEISDEEEEQEIIIDSQPLKGKAKKRRFSKTTKNKAPKQQRQLINQREEGICSRIWDFFTCGCCESDRDAQVKLKKIYST